MVYRYSVEVKFDFGNHKKKKKKKKNGSTYSPLFT